MLDMKKLNQQMLDLYKTTFDNSYATLLMAQEQLERMGTMYWSQMMTVPDEVKRDLAEWTGTCKKNCAEFKKVVDDEFKKLEGYLA